MKQNRCLKNIGTLRKNAETIKSKWVDTFGTRVLKKQTIYDIRDKFDSTGIILNSPKISRPETVCTEEI